MRIQHESGRPYGTIKVHVFADCNCPGLDCPHGAAFEKVEEAIEVFTEQLSIDPDPGLSVVVTSTDWEGS